MSDVVVNGRGPLAEPRMIGSTHPVTEAREDDSTFAVLATPPGRGRRLICHALAECDIRFAAVGSLLELKAGSDRLRPHVIVVDAVLAADRADILGLVRTAVAPLIAVSVQQRALREELLLAGADDCVPAPFTPEELIARIVAVVRRAQRDTTSCEPAVPIRIGPLGIDARARRVRVSDSEVHLTAREFDLLGCFVRHPGETLSRDRLLAEVWGYTIGDPSTVTVHVRRLRAKIESDASRPELIQTVWGVGYRFGIDGAQDDDRDGRGGRALERTSRALEAGVSGSGTLEGTVTGPLPGSTAVLQSNLRAAQDPGSMIS